MGKSNSRTTDHTDQSRITNDPSFPEVKSRRRCGARARNLSTSPTASPAPVRPSARQWMPRLGAPDRVTDAPRLVVPHPRDLEPAAQHIVHGECPKRGDQDLERPEGSRGPHRCFPNPAVKLATERG